MIDAARAVLRRALLRRGSLARRDAYRVLNGPGDGGPAGLAIDRYLSFGVIIAREGVEASVVEAYVEACERELLFEGIVVKRVPRSGPVTNEVRRGEARSLDVHEEDAVLTVELAEGLATGLYLDHHETRRRIRSYVRRTPASDPRGEVLNLFAYTGAFSVHAALAGAHRVTSVDVSRRSLRRAAENFRKSGLAPGEHAFVDADVGSFLRKAARKGRRFGVVVLDPPAFGRAGGRKMSLERDLEELVQAATEVLVPGGVVVLSVHAQKISMDRMVSSLRGSPHRYEELGRFGLPSSDHPTSLQDDPEDRGAYLKVVDARLG